MVRSNLSSAERSFHLSSAREEHSLSVLSLDRRVLSVVRSVVLISIDVGGGAMN